MIETILHSEMFTTLLSILVLAGEIFFFLYSIGYYLAQILLTTLSGKVLWERYQKNLPERRYYYFSGLEPSISVVVPAYNEELTIIAALQSLQQLTYTEYEIIIVNDGSKDNTFGVLSDHCDLELCFDAREYRIPTKNVRGVYRSRLYPNVKIVDKENGGRSDAVNVGLNVASHDLFCCFDADSILRRDALQQLVRPFLSHPDTIAVGGAVRVTNGCIVEDGHLVSIGLSKNIWALIQTVEYIRAFIIGRLGWTLFNALPIISGACGLFWRELIIKVGGYDTGVIGEDMELTLRLHRHCIENNIPYRIQFVSDPLCWTEVPEDEATLRKQRVRWQHGVCQAMALYIDMTFRRRSGVFGWVVMPYLLIFETAQPAIELAGYAFMILCLVLGLITPPIVLLYLALSVVSGIILTLTTLLLEETSYNVYRTPKQMLTLTLVAIGENLGYRQVHAYWRLKGLWQWIRGTKPEWGDMKRTATWSSRQHNS